MENAGVTGEHLTEIPREGLEAARTITCCADGEPRSVEVEDWLVRFRYLELPCRLIGAFREADTAAGEMTYEARLRQFIAVSQAEG